MTDIELLGLAAKAMGESHLSPYNPEWLKSDEAWNPLADDGDALRLAVKLELIIEIAGHAAYAECSKDRKAANGKSHTSTVSMQDSHSATRRAIVRVAAEIGKDMP